MRPSKESFESKSIPRSSFLFSEMMLLLSILALTTFSFPESSNSLFPLFIFV